MLISVDTSLPPHDVIRATWPFVWRLKPAHVGSRLGAWLVLMVTAAPRRNDVLPFSTNLFCYIKLHFLFVFLSPKMFTISNHLRMAYMISKTGCQKAKTRPRCQTIIAIFKPTTWTTDGHIFSTLCHYLSQCDVESDEAHFNEEMQHNASCCCYWCTTLVNNLDVMIVVVVNTLSMIIMITTITNVMIIISH